VRQAVKSSDEAKEAKQAEKPTAPASVPSKKKSK
jgi:hypothetical protein